jgi:hypothetical protein
MALSKSQGDDQAAREDAAENQKSGTDDKARHRGELRQVAEIPDDRCRGPTHRP